jgi:hypothetical protein
MDNTTVSSPPALQSDDVLMETNEVSSMLHIAEATAIKWTNRKKNAIPCIKLGWRTRRYSRAAVLAWIATQGGNGKKS